MNTKSATKNTPGWYQRLFAWLMAHATAKYEAEMSDRKRELFADLHGNVLEIGPGTGPNLRYWRTIFLSRTRSCATKNWTTTNSKLDTAFLDSSWRWLPSQSRNLGSTGKRRI